MFQCKAPERNSDPHQNYREPDPTIGPNEDPDQPTCIISIRNFKGSGLKSLKFYYMNPYSEAKIKGNNGFKKISMKHCVRLLIRGILIAL